MKCQHPDCNRDAWDLPPVKRILVDLVNGVEIENEVTIDDAKLAKGYCCTFCLFAGEDQRPPPAIHQVRCTRRMKGLPIDEED